MRARCWWHLTVVFVALSLLAGCLASPTQLPPTQPAPQAPAPATQPPPTQVSTATPPAQAAPTAQSNADWCSAYHFVFFSGGDPGAMFTVNLSEGAKRAQSDLGPKLDYVYSSWDPERMIQQFKEAVATKPDGIAVLGHPGDESLDALIDQAESAGILVTSQNVTLPKAESKYTANGFGYVGQDLYGSGAALAQAAVKRFGLKPGDRAMVWGQLSMPTRGLRAKGAIEALKDAGLTVDYIEIDSATNNNAPAGTPIFTDYVSAHPDVKLVVLDHGGLTTRAEDFLKAANKKPGELHVAGFDLSEGTVAAIQGGWTELVIDQQPWLQGYLPILQLCLSKKFGFSGLHIDTSGGFVDKSNIQMLAPLVTKNIR
jgi:simple sugar transport system substrate-binding protein